MATLLAVSTVFSGCDKNDDPIDQPNNPPATAAVELNSPITENTTLKDLGLPIDYFYKGSSLLQVKNNATLTIEDSVTIQFTNVNGGIEIIDGATIKALGTDGKRIQFIGATSTKGCWQGIDIHTSTDNQLQYIDIINAGNGYEVGAINLYYENTKLSMTNSSISGSLQHGIYLHNSREVIAAFSNNTITNCDKTPFHCEDIFSVEKIDATSNFTGNGENYVYVMGADIEDKNFTLNGTTVPYYVENGFVVTGGRTLTINKGTTIFIGDNRHFNVNGGAHIIVNGGTGTGEKVTFTHLAGSTYYWQGFEFSDSYGNVIKNAVIEYGGSPNNDANIYAYYRSKISLENVAINNSYGVGFKFNNSTGSDAAVVTHSNVTFNNNAGGNVMLYDETVVEAMP
jgi:hypothetical protein